MIQVVYHKLFHRLTVIGHAQSGEPGHDLVCASASILTYTIAANVSELVKTGQAADMVVKLQEGNAEISCKPHHRLQAIVSLIFDTVCVGFELLAKDYPEYITYEVRG